MRQHSAAVRRSGTALALACLLAASACGNDPTGVSDGADEPAATPGEPTAFAAVDDSVPDGFHRVTCDRIDVGEKSVPLMDDEGRRWAIHLVVPDSFEYVESMDKRCSWSRRWDHGVSVALAPSDTLADYSDEYVEPYEAEGGDDSVSDIAYDVSTTVFGGLDGEKLTWYSFNDGSPENDTAMQANGLRVQVGVPADGPERTEQVQIILDSIRLERVKKS